MKIIDPKIIMKPIDGIDMMKNLEYAAKQCYRTEYNISDDSYKHFLKNCINRGHESVLEHEKISIKMICDIGVYKDLTRHRHASFSIESTRYCNYSKDKFGNQITFIKPLFSDDLTKESYWKQVMSKVEENYINMINIRCTPDETRMILPHSTAAIVYMTANIREWRHILSLRAAKQAHPAVQQVMIPLLKYLKDKMPELFDDIEYNTEFKEEKYAKIEFVSSIRD